MRFVHKEVATDAGAVAGENRIGRSAALTYFNNLGSPLKKRELVSFT